MGLSTLKVNRRGSGSPQYPPQGMSALLIYCYSQGVMISRKSVHYDRAFKPSIQLLPVPPADGFYHHSSQYP